MTPVNDFETMHGNISAILICRKVESEDYSFCSVLYCLVILPQLRWYVYTYEQC